MKGWLVVTLGLVVAVVAAYVLLMSGPAVDPGSSYSQPRSKPGAEAGAEPPAYGEIRPESREKMRDLLRESDQAQR